MGGNAERCASSPALARDFGEHHAGGDGGVERLDGSRHRDAEDRIAVLPNQTRKALAFRADHDDRWFATVEVVERGVAARVEADDLDALRSPILQRASQIRGTSN